MGNNRIVRKIVPRVASPQAPARLANWVGFHLVGEQSVLSFAYGSPVAAAQAEGGNFTADVFQEIALSRETLDAMIVMLVTAYRNHGLENPAMFDHIRAVLDGKEVSGEAAPD